MRTDFRYCPACGKPLTETTTDDELQCACGWVLQEAPRLVVAALVELGETVVLVRNRSWPETSYGLVAGFLEAGETPQEGVLRKVKEEVGLIGEVVGLIGAYPNFPRNQVVLAYHVRAHGRVVAGADIAGVKQVPPEEIRVAPLATGLAVRDWLQHRASSAPLAGA